MEEHVSVRHGGDCDVVSFECVLCFFVCSVFIFDGVSVFGICELFADPCFYASVSLVRW